MATIIRYGTKLEQFYLKRQWECDHCGTIFVVNATDDVAVDDDQREGKIASTRCPYCTCQVHLYERSR